MSDIEPVGDLSQILRHRREKLDEVLERGIEPFAYNYSVTSDTIASIEMFEAAEADDLDGLYGGHVRLRTGCRDRQHAEIEIWRDGSGAAWPERRLAPEAPRRQTGAALLLRRLALRRSPRPRRVWQRVGTAGRRLGGRRLRPRE